MQIKCYILTITLKVNYADQFNIPWFHSWYKPTNKIIIKIIEVVVQINKLE